jgi:hypothetical protein
MTWWVLAERQGRRRRRRPNERELSWCRRRGVSNGEERRRRWAWTESGYLWGTGREASAGSVDLSSKLDYWNKIIFPGFVTLTYYLYTFKYIENK